jgi:serine/threonine-protein kinase
VISAPTDGLQPAGAVVGTNPPAGQSVPKEIVIQLHVSKGNN